MSEATDGGTSGLGELFEAIGAEVSERFTRERRVLSFDQYLELLASRPEAQTRDAACYLRDCFDHFGSDELVAPTGTRRRFRLFDLPFEQGSEASDRLIGQERLQEATYRVLDGFAREGRPTRLLLLHGPNGSAKSTFVRCIARALEAYSAEPEGALYRFSWVFPRGEGDRGIGFGSHQSSSSPRSYAHLPEERIEAKLSGSLREHPLLLLPRAARARLVRQAYDAVGVSAPLPEWVARGELGRMNRDIFDALLTAYRGDLSRVLAHVSVERWYVSRRYRRGAVTLGPEMAVDAKERQLTADRTLSQLPASLSALTLFEPYGELVDAYGGVLEYSDLLKRPLDAWKYLLLAIETGEVALSTSTLPLNSVLFASSNDLHLHAFKEHPEYHSFQGRLVLLGVPYLCDHRAEAQIYSAQVVPRVLDHVAPHAVFVAALWATLTRLRRADAESYEDPLLGEVAQSLSPLEKADLYADGRMPGRLEADEAKTLRQGIAAIAGEGGSGSLYEGGFGASPREVRAILLAATADPNTAMLSPADVLGAIEEFCYRDDFDFLKLEPDQGYHDARGFVAQVRERWLDAVEDELRAASGLVPEGRYEQLWARYVTHVSFWVKKERVYNSVTGSHEDPDQELMDSIEAMLGVSSSAEVFRRDLMGQVAAHAIDHPEVDVEYQSLFPRYLSQVRDAYFAERRGALAELANDVLRSLDADAKLAPEAAAKAEQTREAMERECGYIEASLRVALGTLLRERYDDLGVSHGGDS
ncbi:MAG: serine protein kinase PrkA [Deltaproteobacteria bacterium]|nr:serine protein kinase PrkA [Deltaproteobacteria bacterium]